MSRLDVVEDALTALAAFLDAHGHGAACVCGPCTAYRQATELLIQLDHLLTILEAWNTAEWVEGDYAVITQEELQEALRVLDDACPGPRAGDRTPRPPADAGKEGG